MSLKGFRDVVEQRIQEAMRRGELDGLPGEGKPLKVDDLPGVSSEERMEAILRGGGNMPEEVELLRELAALRERYDRTTDDEERQKLRSTMRDKATRLSILFEAGGRPLMAQQVLTSIP